MKKTCKTCNVNKKLELFRKWRNQCKECTAFLRKRTYEKSTCRHCKNKYIPGVQGRYKFCSEMCRFMNKVKINTESECWIWQAAMAQKHLGYGTFVAQGKKSGLAHRTSYRLFKGNFPADKCVLHSCHNRFCVNPDHLKLGTPLQNTIDRKRAGRTTARKSSTLLQRK